MSDTKQTVIVEGSEVMFYLKKIRNYVNELVVDLDRNITDLEVKLSEVSKDVPQGDEDNG